MVTIMTKWYLFIFCMNSNTHIYSENNRFIVVASELKIKLN